MSDLAREGERGVSAEARAGERGVSELAQPADDPADEIVDEALSTRARLRAIRERSRRALRQPLDESDASLDAQAGAGGRGRTSLDADADASLEASEDAGSQDASTDDPNTGAQPATGDTSDPREWNRNILNDPRDWNRNPSSATIGGVPSAQLTREAELRSRANITAGADATTSLDLSSLLPPDIGVWFLDSSRNGLVIDQLARTGAIAQFGFREGDRILSVNGQQVLDGDDFMTTLFAQEVLSQRVPVVVSRSGRQRIIFVQPNLIVDQLGSVSTDPLQEFGVTFDDRFSDQLRVWRVEPRSPAFFAGLRPGDVITGVDGQSIMDLGAFSLLLMQADAEFVLQVNRNGRLRTLDVDLAELASASARFASRFGQSRRGFNRLEDGQDDFLEDDENVFNGRRFNLPPKPEVPPGTWTIEELRRRQNLPAPSRRGQDMRSGPQRQLPRLNIGPGQNPGSSSGRQFNLVPKPEVPPGTWTIEGQRGGGAPGGGAGGVPQGGGAGGAGGGAGGAGGGAGGAGGAGSGAGGSGNR